MTCYDSDASTQDPELLKRKDGSDYDSDEICSQALDLFEEQEERQIFLTQNTFATEEEREALKKAIDVTDMAHEHGPYLVGADRFYRVKQVSTTDTVEKTENEARNQRYSLRSATSTGVEQPSLDSLRSATATGIEQERSGQQNIGQQNMNKFKRVTSSDIKTNQARSVPQNTLRQNQWAMNIYEKWRDEMKSLEQAGSDTEKDLIAILNKGSLLSLSDDEVVIVLSAFFVAARRENGEEYKGDTIYNIACALQRHLELNGRNVNFFTDAKFKQLRNSIDNMMQQKCKMGIGLQKRVVEIITEEQENFLWAKGILNCNGTPLSLFRAVFWTIGVNFGLRGGEEHRQLTFDNFALKLDDDGNEYLLYTQTVSKTYKGGLDHRSIEPHSARAYENTVMPARCPVRIFKFYKGKLPINLPSDAFYFKPSVTTKNSNEGIDTKPWFTRSPMGHNKLRTVVSDIMSDAGIQGYFTNHSLRATTATRLFRANVPEQLIMEQTGHRSKAISAYKRSSNMQKQGVSSVIQLQEPEPEKPGCGAFAPVKRKQDADTRPSASSAKQIHLQNCTVTFNVN